MPTAEPKERLKACASTECSNLPAINDPWRCCRRSLQAKPDRLLAIGNLQLLAGLSICGDEAYLRRWRAGRLYLSGLESAAFAPALQRAGQEVISRTGSRPAKAQRPTRVVRPAPAGQRGNSSTCGDVLAQCGPAHAAGPPQRASPWPEAPRVRLAADPQRSVSTLQRAVGSYLQHSTRCPCSAVPIGPVSLRPVQDPPGGNPCVENSC
jgi:hypothetical protein